MKLTIAFIVAIVDGILAVMSDKHGYPWVSGFVTAAGGALVATLVTSYLGDLHFDNLARQANEWRKTAEGKSLHVGRLETTEEAMKRLNRDNV